LKNIDKLYELHARIPGSIWHVRIHGYRYIKPISGEEIRGKLLDTDIAIYGFLYLNSDMRDPIKKGGTGLTQYFSARLVSKASQDEFGVPAWSEGTIRRSLQRLCQAGFLIEKNAVRHTMRVKLFDPLSIPSRRYVAEEQVAKTLGKPSEDKE